MGVVARQSALTHRILAMLADHPGLLLEELLDRCPDATWNQLRHGKSSGSHRRHSLDAPKAWASAT